MPTIKKTFLKGKMNLDVDERLLPDGEYREALNIRVSNSEGSDVGAIEKSLSNKVLTALALGNNVYTLGKLRDEFEEKIYWAVLSDNGCYVIEHDVNAGTTAFVLEDTRAGSLNVLGFVPNKRLQMSLIVDSDNGNRLLAFTDDNTQPKCINVERAKTYGENGFDEEMILLIKKPPLYAPTIVLGNTIDEENNLEEKFIKFAYRYKYLDGEYSALSPFSDFAFFPKVFKYDFATGSNESMVNAYNKVDISFNTGGSLITDIEIIFKESGSNTLYLIEKFNKEEENWNIDFDTETFEFSNNKIYRALPEKELYRLYDNVPLSAKVLAVINNRIVFSNYTENYNLLDSSNNVVYPNITVTQTNTIVTEGVATKSIKSNRDYEIAIAYIDDYGRMTTPLTSKNNTAYIKNKNSIKQNKLQTTILHNPPAFAKYYRFFVKQTKSDYETIVPVLFYEDGAYRWIKLENSDKDKIKEGDFLVVKSDSQNNTNLLSYVKVLEIKEQEDNFLTPLYDAGELFEERGYYFKIKPDFRMNRDDFTFIEWSNSSKSYWSNHGIGGFISLSPCIESPIYYGTGNSIPSLSSSGIYSGTEDIRYLVEVDAYQIGAEGTVTLDSGISGSIDSITVNGVEIMSGAEAFDTDLNTTAANVAANITLNTSVPNYTASASSGVVTIAAIDLGTAPNGFVVVSSATTIVTSDVNMSGGINNTFRWSIDNGANWVAEFIPIVQGFVNNLSNGLEVTFDDTDLSYDVNDNWIISAKKQMPSYDNHKAYGMYMINDPSPVVYNKGETILPEDINENILSGARITMIYDEYGEENVDVNFSDTSTNDYDNIEEWFYGEGIKSYFEAEGRTLESIWFRRGVPVDNVFTQDITQPMVMIVRSDGTKNNQYDGDAKVKASITVFQSEIKVVLETKPINVDSDIFNEIGETYPIIDGYHISNNVGDINQTAIADAIINLPLYNCFIWGNGYESYKIKDEFNAKTMKLDTRPSTPIENYRQNKRIASYTWSNVYEQTTNYNALNEFNLGLVNYNDLDDKYGAIQAMVSWDNDLDVWQEDKVGKILYDKSVIYNKDGSSNLAKTDDILINYIPYTGEFGISTSPESLVTYGNYTYWADSKRGVFLRKGRSGIEVISNFGIKDWTRDAMINLSTYILGGYDPYFGLVVFNLNGYTLTFNEQGNGWTSFHSWLPDEMVRINNRFYTIKEGQLYLHNDGDNAIVNTFYDTKYSSEVTTVFNEQPSEDKIFKNIIQEGTHPWKTTIVTNMSNGSIQASEFNQRESKWLTHLRKNESATDLTDRAQGIGNIISVSGVNITFAQLPTLISTGEDLYQLNGSAQELIGTIYDISGNTITVDAVVTTPVIGYFAYSVKDARVQGSEIRGYYAKVTLENSDDENVELFAINTNVKPSFVLTNYK